MSPEISDRIGSVPVTGAQLGYRIRRAGEGGMRRVVVMHGFTRTGDAQWGPEATAFLADALGPHELLIPDMRGHGRSPIDAREAAGGLPHPQIGRDLESVVDALRFDPAHFIGFSSGGIGMLYLVLRRPDLFLSLTLIATSYRMGEQGTREVLRMRGSRDEPWYPEMVAELDAIHREGQGPGHGERVLDMWAHYATPPRDPDITVEQLRTIRVPTLIVHGDRDRFFPVCDAEVMAREMREAELCVLPRCGHMIRDRHARRMMEMAIVGFLERQGAGDER